MNYYRVKCAGESLPKPSAGCVCVGWGSDIPSRGRSILVKKPKGSGLSLQILALPPDSH
ncbi:hypothetical protein BC628DRAFT_1359069 [Trametes gibbosa]|nr:hypothetical protein BC628DRAFT_1359069 [Trametes gibbosa]